MNRWHCNPVLELGKADVSSTSLSNDRLSLVEHSPHCNPTVPSSGSARRNKALPHGDLQVSDLLQGWLKSRNETCESRPAP